MPVRRSKAHRIAQTMSTGVIKSVMPPSRLRRAVDQSRPAAKQPQGPQQSPKFCEQRSGDSPRMAQMMPGADRSQHTQEYACESTLHVLRAKQVVVGAHGVAGHYRRQMTAEGPGTAIGCLKMADAGAGLE